MSDAPVSPVHSEQASKKERRLNPRTKMAEIAYMNLQAENGGIVLDVSASGLGFQLASSMAAEREISFRLSAEGIEDLEISAQVAWLDADRKRGGLRFGPLPEKVRDRIYRWAGIPAAPGAVLPDPVVPVAAKSSAPGQYPKREHVGRSLISEMNPYSLTGEAVHTGSMTSASSRRPLDGLPNPLRANSGFGSMLSPEPGREIAHRRRLSGAIALPILLLLAAGVFVFNDKHQVGASMIRLGERLAGEYSHQPASSAPPAVAPSSVTSAPGPPEFATVAPLIGAPSATTPNASEPDSTDSASKTGSAVQSTLPVHRLDSGPASVAQGSNHENSEARAGADRSRESDAPNFALRSEHVTVPEKSHTRNSDEAVRQDDGHTELALARQYLRGTTVPKDRDMAAHLLWVAVGEGNPQAELELADLYLGTDGVPQKNCAQARILLNDSSNSGNAEASQQLANIRSYGCR
jgi:hypothetical protein